MICPGCASAMSAITLEGQLGTQIELDLCTPCHAFWFDRYESPRLAPSATLKLFATIAEQGSTSRPFPQTMACPRCGAHLALTHDMQRATRFQYWRCPREHGHFITFLEFLKEKDFVRPLTPQQIAELRQNIQSVNCSNCGGSIDLAKESICPHCGSALSMLDMKQMAAHVRELELGSEVQAGDKPSEESGLPQTPGATILAGLLGQSAGQTRDIDPTGVQLDHEKLAKLEVERQFAAIAQMSAGGGSQSLVEAGFRLLIRCLGK